MPHRKPAGKTGKTDQPVSAPSPVSPGGAYALGDARPASTRGENPAEARGEKSGGSSGSGGSQTTGKPEKHPGKFPPLSVSKDEESVEKLHWPSFYRDIAPGWYRRFQEYFFVGILLLCVGALTKRLGQADILGDQGLGKNLKSILPIADILYYVGTAVESNFPLIVAFMLAFAAAKRPNTGVALAALAGWSGYLGSTAALSQYSAGASVGVVTGIDLGIFGGILIGFSTAICWSMFRFRHITVWARLISGIPLVIVISATAGVLLGIVVGVFYQVAYLLISLSLGAAFLNMPEPLSAALYGFLHPVAEMSGWGNLLNITPFTQYGSCQAPSGDTLKGSYNCFIYGANQVTGQQALFLAGGYPVVGFGLTTLFLVVWLQLKGENRQYWRILYWLVTLAVFLAGFDKVGIYLLAFTAPVLLVVHMVASAVSYAVSAVFMVSIGWAGGPGIIDLIRWNQSGSGLIIVIILGVFFAAMYLIVGMLYTHRPNKSSHLPGWGILYVKKPFMGIPASPDKHRGAGRRPGEPKMVGRQSQSKVAENQARTAVPSLPVSDSPSGLGAEATASRREFVRKVEEPTPDAPGSAAVGGMGKDSKGGNGSAPVNPLVGLPVLPESPLGANRRFNHAGFPHAETPSRAYPARPYDKSPYAPPILPPGGGIYQGGNRPLRPPVGDTPQVEGKLPPVPPVPPA